MAGILWAVAAGVGFGIFQVTNRKGGLGIDVYRGTFVLLLISSVLLVIISAATEDLSALSSASIKGLLLFALAGFIHFFTGWTLITVSQKQIGAARTGATIGSTPLFGAILASVLLGEMLKPGAILGILLVVTGVYLVTSR